jgi:osmotically-inducible protein OsmY
MRTIDAKVHAKVLAELESEAALREQEIGVAVQGGVVTLSGKVDRYEQKQIAEQAASRVPGVEAIAEELHVKAPGPVEVTDTEIAHLVAVRLKSRNHDPAHRVTAKVERGYVTLQGEVCLYREKASFEQSLKGLRGVRGVINLIRISPPKLAEDVKSRIEMALVRRASRQADRISVEIEQGKVILNGTIPSASEKLEAIMAARAVPGASEVEDRLAVVGDGGPS